MIRGLNQVNLIGHAGADAIFRVTPSQVRLATFSLATNERYVDKDTGEERESTTWHHCIAFRNFADVIANLVKKGTLVYVCGSIRNRKWTDRDGATRYSTDIIVERLEMLTPRAPDPASEPAAAPAAAGPTTAQQDGDGIPY